MCCYAVSFARPQANAWLVPLPLHVLPCFNPISVLAWLLLALDRLRQTCNARRPYDATWGQAASRLPQFRLISRGYRVNARTRFMSTDHTYLSAPRQAIEGKKYFSLEEANRALSYVSPIARELTEEYHRAILLHQKLEQALDGTPLDQVQDDYEASMDRLNVLMEELQQVGVELKDFEKGLIDFPAVYDGREIYLCWQLGEDRVEAWHELDAGYGGRQDIAQLSTST